RMSDIADIARVRREVVTMWRKRPAPSGHPFPEPIAEMHGEQWFDADAIGDYLAGTGRGNNPTAADDIAAVAALEPPPGDAELVGGAGLTAPGFDAVTALLAVRAADDEPLSGIDRDALLDRADTV